MTDANRKTSDAAQSRTLKIWDVPVRLFHWSLVVLLGIAWWSAEQRQLDWHRYAGYSILALVLFRLLWGFFGSTTARFSHFVSGPARVTDYLRNDLFAHRSHPYYGHNPLGGWSIIAMLGLMLLQTMLGLFSVDVDGIESGPLSYLVSFDTGRLAAETHHWIFNELLALVVIHIVAILFYRFYKKENLVSAMILGSKSWNGDAKPALHFPPVLRAIVLFTLSALAVFIMVKFFGR